MLGTEETTKMTESKSNSKRRSLLKSIAAGSGAIVAGKSLPESWSKPVVDAVILPAHAETTDESISDPTTAAPTTTVDPCCNIAGTYCGYYGEGGAVQITVESSGALTIELDYGRQVLMSSVECDGGSFNTAEDYPDAPPGSTVVTGTVVCNLQPIIGQVIISGSQARYDYSAALGVCID